MKSRRARRRLLAAVAGPVIVLFAFLGYALGFAGTASAHEVTSITADCTYVTVHFADFPDTGVTVHISANIEGHGTVATDVVVTSATTEAQLDISSVTGALAGATANVDVEVSWTLNGFQDVQQTLSVTCGTATTTTTQPATTTTAGNTTTTAGNTTTTAGNTTTTAGNTTTTQPSTTTTVGGSTTTTVGGSTTTTVAGGTTTTVAGETTTTVAGGTTTTVAGGTTTTTAPSTTTTLAGGTTTTTPTTTTSTTSGISGTTTSTTIEVGGASSGAPGGSGGSGVLSQSVTAGTNASASGESAFATPASPVTGVSLPFTGDSSGPLAVGGVVLLTIGALAGGIARRRTPRS